MWKTLAVLVVLLSAASAAAYWYVQDGLRIRASGPWNSNAITAIYLDAQLKEIDPQNADLLLSYYLANNTSLDYHLGGASDTVIMSRLSSDSSLSSREDIRLTYPTFLPAQQRTRVELEIRHAFDWPAERDPSFQNKLKDFVNQRLADLDELVLFDQRGRCEIRFPSGWQELRLASAVGTDQSKRQ